MYYQAEIFSFEASLFLLSIAIYGGVKTLLKSHSYFFICGNYEIKFKFVWLLKRLNPIVGANSKNKCLFSLTKL